jgi:rubrerythrin
MSFARTQSLLDDLTFDIITVLQKKARAIEAYDKYQDDAAEDGELAELFARIQRDDEAHVRELKVALVRRLDAERGYEEEEEEGEDDDFVGVEASDGPGRGLSSGRDESLRRS